MRKLPYLVTAAALVGLTFLVVAYLALNSARIQTIFAGVDTTQQNANSSGTILYDDPLITYVPAGDRSVDQKTKVFVSSADPMLGTNQAKVYVVLYGTLVDTEMQQYLAEMVDLQASYGDDVAVVWKDNAVGDLELQSAVIGHCADSVGRFWDYAGALVDNVPTDEDGYKQLALDQGVNTVELEDCLATSGASAQVTQSTGLADPLGVTTTHTVFVNDRLFTDSITIDQLKQTIDETLASF